MRRFAAVHFALAGYVAGLVLALCDPRWAIGAILGGALAVALFALAARRFEPRAVARLLALVPLCALPGLLVGGARLDDLHQSRLRDLAGSRASIVATVLTLPDVSGDSASLDVEVGSVDGRPLVERARLQIDAADGWPGELGDSCAGLVEGTVLRLDGIEIEPLPPAKPGRFDYGRYLERRGVHAVLAAPLERVVVAGRRGGVAGAIDGLRLAARRHLRRGVSSPVREVLEAMVLGDDNAVDEGAVEAFRRSGLLHIMAVSGENVVLLCSIAGLGLRLAGVRRRTRTLGLIPVVVLYVIVTGATPSIVRAGVAGVVALLATLVSRPSDGWLLWLLPGAYMLTINPNSLFDVSFQLSFAAVAGLLVLSRPLTRWLSFLPAGVAESAGVTTAATISTAPVSLATFGSVSAVSVPANLVGGFVLGPIMLLGMVSVLIGFVSPVLSLPLNLVAGLFTGFLLAVARVFSGLSFAVWEWHGLTRPLCVCVALVAEMAIVGWYARRAGVTLSTYAGDRRRRSRLVAATVLVVVLVVVLAPGPPRAPDAATLTFMSVGEGAAAVFQAPKGPTILFDTGPSPPADHLRGLGVKRIDLLVFSHGHSDHTGGLDDLLSHFEVEQAVVADEGPAPQTLSEELAKLHAAGVPVSTCRSAQTLSCGLVTVTIVPTGGPAGAGGNQGENDCALVALVDFGGERVLLPGDAEGEALEGLALPPCEVVELPHHGSAGGLDEALLAALDPSVVVVSVGENRFGHPTAEMLDLVAAQGLPLWRTDLDGDLSLQAGSRGLQRVPSPWTQRVP